MTELLRRFGGHARAAGFTVASADLDSLVERCVHNSPSSARAVSQGAPLPGSDGSEALLVDCRLPLNRIKLDTYILIRALAPFGPQFPEPHFVCRDAQIVRCWRSGPGGRNLRVSLRDSTGMRTALWSRHGDWSEAFQAELGSLPRFDVVYTLGAYRPPSGELELIPRIVTLTPAGNTELNLSRPRWPRVGFAACHDGHSEGIASPRRLSPTDFGCGPCHLTSPTPPISGSPSPITGRGPGGRGPCPRGTTAQAKPV